MSQMQWYSHVFEDCMQQIVTFGSFGQPQYPNVDIQGHVFRVRKKLGEGGYSEVYLVTQVDGPTLPGGQPDGAYAVKKVVGGSAERTAAAVGEAKLMTRLNHPNVLRLVAWSKRDPGGDVHMLFPAYLDGTLAEEVSRWHARSTPLPSRLILDIFCQVASGLAHVHSLGVAHRDVKPHNVLISRPSRDGNVERRKADLGDVEVGSSLLPSAEDRYEAVLMDFGSAAPALVPVPDRRAALAIQEEAEAHCTIVYRAPELFDVRDGCTLDYSAADVWSLGATLFHVMYGASPGQMAVDQGGGSPALAALNCRLPWPSQPACCYPSALHQLVSSCVVSDPGSRPTASNLAARAREILNNSPELPNPQLCYKL